AGESGVDGKREGGRSIESALSRSDWVCSDVRLKMKDNLKVEIPSDLRAYLEANPNQILELNPMRVPHTNLENIQLTSLEQLTIEDIPLDTYDYALNQGDFDGEDPEWEYEFPGVNLVARDLDEQFDPWGLLLWFPSLQCYGSWDNSHHLIYTFPGATWTDVISSIVFYGNAQWEPESDSHRLLRPWLEQGFSVDMSKYRRK
ncbi:hypothetical protein, partial [Roseibacillus persicicus]|uniref:hypothetical protein n=1 Tax=Roseibacillus persicicus TaxID=454148 RepID=UPI00281057B7